MGDSATDNKWGTNCKTVDLSFSEIAEQIAADKRAMMDNSPFIKAPTSTNELPHLDFTTIAETAPKKEPATEKTATANNWGDVVVMDYVHGIMTAQKKSGSGKPADTEKRFFNTGFEPKNATRKHFTKRNDCNL